VANRFDEKGNQVGYSGPVYRDQKEISWADIGQEVELTTVTKLPRRLFTFSYQQMYFAMKMCHPSLIFLNFVNYLDSFEKFENIYEFLYTEGAEIVFGVGPTYDDVVAVSLPRTRHVWDFLYSRMKGK
jgi:hypothetical protein